MKKIIFSALTLLSQVTCNDTKESDNKKNISSEKFEENSYAPRIVECPSKEPPYVRVYPSLGYENGYQGRRRSQVNSAIFKFLNKHNNYTKIFLEDLIGAETINIALAFSGGVDSQSGYEAFFKGLGQIDALDEKSDSSPLSGILQASSYISGVSSGAWLVSALALHGFPKIQELLESPDTFSFKQDLITPYGEDMEKNQHYWDELAKQIYSKKSAGFEITIVDILGRALAFQLFGKKFGEGAPNFTLSSIRNTDAFQKANLPFPSLLAQFPQTNLSSDFKSPIFKMNPYNCGSKFDPVHAYMSTRYLGSRVNEKKCIQNYDNLGYLMAASSSEMVHLVDKLVNPSPDNPVKYSGDSLFDLNLETNNSFARIRPNSFSKNEVAGTDDLLLSYGSANGLDLPMHPFSLSGNHMEVVFAFGNSADPENTCPAGPSLRGSYEGIEDIGPTDIQIIDEEEFNAKGFNKKPVFFGCSNWFSPLVIYIPNNNCTASLNLSPSQSKFSDEEIEKIVDCGRASVSLIEGEFKDEDWGACVSCAIIHHSLIKFGPTDKFPSVCEKCFDKYCFDEMPKDD